MTMQSVESPLLGDDSLSSLLILPDISDIPDNRRHIHEQDAAVTKPKITNNKTSSTTTSQTTSSETTTTSTTSTHNDDDVDEDDHHDDGDPLLRSDNVEITNLQRQQQQSQQSSSSTLFSPMSESCGSSLIGDSVSESNLATPMEISRPESRGSTEFTTMKQSQSQLDWRLIERQLQKTQEREELRRFAKNDREEIRRKLAMGGDDETDVFSEVLRFSNSTSNHSLRRSSSAANSSLQICYINNDDDDDDDDDDDEDVALTWDGSSYSSERRKDKKKSTTDKMIKKKPEVRKPATQLFAEASRLGGGGYEEEEEERNLLSGGDPGGVRAEGSGDGVCGTSEDFLAKQAKLQAEAKMALAQTLPMAKMQMELEKMNRKKSPIADIVGLQGGFLDDANKKLTPRTLLNLNLAQLQVIFNDLHTQIENFNDLLLKNLEERDDLHMEQDAKLVDIEDLTRRLKQMAFSSTKGNPKTSTKNQKN